MAIEGITSMTQTSWCGCDSPSRTAFAVAVACIRERCEAVPRVVSTCAKVNLVGWSRTSRRAGRWSSAARRAPGAGQNERRRGRSSSGPQASGHQSGPRGSAATERTASTPTPIGRAQVSPSSRVRSSFTSTTRGPARAPACGPGAGLRLRAPRRSRARRGRLPASWRPPLRPGTPRRKPTGRAPLRTWAALSVERDDDLAVGAALLYVRQRLEGLVERERLVDERAEVAGVVECG